jgi:hypothetical protein
MEPKIVKPSSCDECPFYRVAVYHGNEGYCRHRGINLSTSLYDIPKKCPLRTHLVLIGRRMICESLH